MLSDKQKALIILYLNLAAKQWTVDLINARLANIPEHVINKIGKLIDQIELIESQKINVIWNRESNEQHNLEISRLTQKLRKVLEL